MKKRTRKQIVEEKDKRLEWNSHSRERKKNERTILRLDDLYGGKYCYDADNLYSEGGQLNVFCREYGLFNVSLKLHLKGLECPYCNPWGKKYMKTRKERSAKSVEKSMSYKRKVVHTSEKEKVKNEKYMNLRFADPIPKVSFTKKQTTIRNKSAKKTNNKGKILLSVFNNKIPSKGEQSITNFLDTNGIEYVCQQKFENEYLFNIHNYMMVDFYLPKHNTIIEYNGQQHYYPVKWFGGEEAFEHQQERDHALRLYCKEHQIRLVEIPYTEESDIENILLGVLELV